MQHSIYPPLDLKQTLSAKRLLGLWRLLGGFQWVYLAAIISLALATAARSVTYLLLQYFVDDVLIQKKAATPFYLIALGFVSLAVFQGAFTFISGKLAARSGEGAILRLRNYLFDHIQGRMGGHFANPGQVAVLRVDNNQPFDSHVAHGPRGGPDIFGVPRPVQNDGNVF